MKSGLIFSLFLVLLAIQAYGLNVELTFPVNNAVYVDSNSVVFKCKAIGDDLRFIELYSNVNGWSKKAEISSPTSNTEVTFSLQNISNGDYLWNCKAIDGIEGIKFSASNRTFSISQAPNNPPSYNGGLTSLSWNMNSEKKNAFDLDNYFSDVDGDALSFGVSGNNNIVVNIDASNLVSFYPPSNWFGTEKVYFTASDGKANINSNQINLTVLKTTSVPINSPPAIDPRIPDQNKSLDLEVWFLDLDDYGKDTEDSSSKLNWYVEGVYVDLIKVDIDNTLKRAKFTAQGKTGTDMITFIVSDSNGLNASQSLKVSLYEETSSSDSAAGDFSEFQEEKESVFAIKLITPSEKEVVLKENEIKVFKIETSQKGDYEWYLNGELTIESKNYFSFNSNNEGPYNLTIYASDLSTILSNEWSIIVRKEEVIIKQEPICGNSIVEENENCSNCPSDVKCNEGQKCEDNICVEKKLLDFSAITGNITGIFDNNYLKTTGYALLSVFVVLFVSVLMIRRKNKQKYSNLTRLDEEEGFIKGLQKKLRKIDERRKEKKEQKLRSRELEGKSREDILSITPSSMAIINFIKDGLAQGHSKGIIKKSLRKKGWTRIQIWRAFKNL